MNRKRLILTSALVLALAACSGDGADETTTSTEAVTSTTESANTTATSAAEVTTTTGAETTTTEAAPEASGDLAAIQAAMANTAQEVPSRVEGAISVSGLDDSTGVPEFDMTFTVTTDAETGDSTMVMDFGDLAGMMGEELPEDIPAEMAGMLGEMEVRQIGETTYLRFPFFAMLFGAQTEWISMPAEDGGGITEGLGPEASPSDPTEFLDSFSDAEGTVEDLGEEDVRGVTTTHYRLLTDEGWVETLSPQALAGLEDQGFVAGSSLPLELWVDADGLVHRMGFEIDGSELPEGEDEFDAMSWSFDFFEFGESVTIEAPPADQVTDVDDLAGPFSGSGS